MKQADFETDRVRRSTAPEVNQRIDEEIRDTVRRYANAPAALISQRIGALETEWDVERVLEANASTLGLAGVFLGLAGQRRGLLLTAIVLGFLLTHATKGWCPPLPLLRRLGVRTRREIEHEKFVLKYLRGDFSHLRSSRRGKKSQEVLAAVQS